MRGCMCSQGGNGWKDPGLIGVVNNSSRCGHEHGCACMSGVRIKNLGGGLGKLVLLGWDASLA